MKNLLTTVTAVTLSAAPVLADPTEWTLDLGHSYLGWEIDHMNIANTVGRFNDYDGTFLIDEENPANSQITFTVITTSIDSNHTERDGHLRSPDYLNVEAFPEMTFTSTEVQMLTPTSGKLIG